MSAHTRRTRKPNFFLSCFFLTFHLSFSKLLPDHACDHHWQVNGDGREGPWDPHLWGKVFVYIYFLDMLAKKWVGATTSGSVVLSEKSQICHCDWLLMSLSGPSSVSLREGAPTMQYRFPCRYTTADVDSIVFSVDYFLRIHCHKIT